MLKTCQICRNNKPLSEYCRDRNRYDGRDPRCSACRKNIDQARRDSRKELKNLNIHRFCVICREEKTQGQLHNYYRGKYANICEPCFISSNIAEWCPEIVEYEDIPTSAYKVKVSSRVYLQRFKAEGMLYLGGQCAHCELRPSRTCPLAVFDFHHKDPSKKELNPTILFKQNRTDLTRVFHELDKCILLCSNCHRKEHWRMNRNE